MSLPDEVTRVVGEVVTSRPDDDIRTIVSKVIETLGGRSPKKLVGWMDSAGGPQEFVQAVLSEARRIQADRATQRTGRRSR